MFDPRRGVVPIHAIAEASNLLAKDFDIGVLVGSHAFLYFLDRCRSPAATGQPSQQGSEAAPHVSSLE
jgi:hypothetical protein